MQQSIVAITYRLRACVRAAGKNASSRASPIRWARRCLVLVAFVFAHLLPIGAQAASADLYEAVTIVTGQREETRLPGIRTCFLDVLQKVSGDQTLAGEAAVAKLADQAGSFVTGYRYQDRLWRRPIHDEQGTRDRPHDLTVDFDPARIDDVLRALGREPWMGLRPRVAALVAVRQGSLAYITSTDGPHGYGQADAFDDAAATTGVAVVVPSQDELNQAKLDEERLRNGALDDLAGLAKQLGADASLIGDMVFSDAAGGWVITWRFLWRGAEHRWKVSGVNFDAAFLNGMRGVAQIASGHGSPS